MGKRVRVQASKRDRAKAAALNGNTEMAQAFRELRRSSASEPHRNRAKYSRNDWRREAQSKGY